MREALREKTFFRLSLVLRCILLVTNLLGNLLLHVLQSSNEATTLPTPHSLAVGSRLKSMPTFLKHGLALAHNSHVAGDP